MFKLGFKTTNPKDLLNMSMLINIVKFSDTNFHTFPLMFTLPKHLPKYNTNAHTHPKCAQQIPSNTPQNRLKQLNNHLLNRSLGLGCD